MASVIKALSKLKSRFLEGNQKLQGFVQTIQIIQNNLPKQEDGLVAKSLKMLAMASTLVQLIPDDQETATAKAAKLYDLTECYNPGFMDLFRDFGLMKHYRRFVKNDNIKRKFRAAGPMNHLAIVILYRDINQTMDRPTIIGISLVKRHPLFY